MYVDDGSLVDLASAKGAGQALIYEFFDAIGTGLSPDKREWMSQTSTFLGVEHSFARLMQEDEIVFLAQGGDRARAASAAPAVQGDRAVLARQREQIPRSRRVRC